MVRGSPFFGNLLLHLSDPLLDFDEVMLHIRRPFPFYMSVPLFLPPPLVDTHNTCVYALWPEWCETRPATKPGLPSPLSYLYNLVTWLEQQAKLKRVP